MSPPATAPAHPDPPGYGMPMPGPNMFGGPAPGGLPFPPTMHTFGQPGYPQGSPGAFGGPQGNPGAFGQPRNPQDPGYGTRPYATGYAPGYAPGHSNQGFNYGFTGKSVCWHFIKHPSGIELIFFCSCLV